MPIHLPFSTKETPRHMDVLYYLLYLLMSYQLLMLVFRWTTYHAHFWKGLPFLLAFGVASGYLLYAFELHSFFLWHVGIMSIVLFRIGRRQDKQIATLMHLAQSVDEARAISESGANTKRYYAYSSIIYIVSFSVSYLYIFNVSI